MIKIRGSEAKKYKGGLFKRLVRESLILSWLGWLSDRVTRLITSSFLFRVFCGCEEADAMLKNGFLGRFTRKINPGNSLIQPLKIACSKCTDESRFVRAYRKIVNLLLTVPVRFFGILFFTFGLYGTGIFFAKHFSFIARQADVRELFWSVFFVGAGFPLLFSGKSVALSLRTSRIFRWLFISVLGVKEITLKEKKKTDLRTGTLAFVLGTALGVSSIFVNPEVTVKAITLAVILSGLLYMPELGLMSAILLFPIVSVKVLALLFIVTITNYVFKLARAKRNLQFKTADVFVLLFALFTVSAGVISGSGGQIRAWYMLCFISVYFLINNLIVSRTLLRQMFYSMCIGAGASCLLYILSYFVSGRDISLFDGILQYMDSSLVKKDGYGFFLVIMIPLCLSLMKALTRKSERAGMMVLLSLVTVCIFIRADKETYLAAYAVLVIYSLFSLKKPIITIVSYGISALVLYFLIPYIPNIREVFAQSSSNLLQTQTGNLVLTFMLTGVGIGNEALVNGLNFVGSSNYIGSLGLFGRLLAEGGLFYFIIFLLVAFFVLQRAFYCISRNRKSSTENIQASLSSAVVLFLFLGIFFDMWKDIRIFLLFWSVCGMISAVKNVYGRYLYVRGEKEQI